MLVAKDVTKYFNNTLANDHVSLHLPPGKTGILAGPNGAGKSTLIKCVIGLLRYMGEITIDGHPNRGVEAKRLLGYVPEMPALYPLLTVEEHLEFIARAYRLEDDWKQRGDVLLERMDMDDKRKKLGSELSKGMQQKVSICCAVLPRPRLILLDEPMVGLDPRGIKELKEIVRELREEGCSLLISTHILDSVQDIWDYAFIMMQGHIAAERAREEIDQSGESLEELFFQITEGGDHS